MAEMTMTKLKVTPEDEKRVKAMGFLRNKGTDCFSGRIITVNGKITAAQNKCLSEATDLYGNGVVTLTTRLTIECQGIHYDNIEKFQEYIAKEGLVTGGTGSKVRPVVSCKGLVNAYTCFILKDKCFDIASRCSETKLITIISRKEIIPYGICFFKV